MNIFLTPSMLASQWKIVLNSAKLVNRKISCFAAEFPTLGIKMSLNSITEFCGTC